MKKIFFLSIISLFSVAAYCHKFVQNIWEDVPSMKHHRVIMEVSVPENCNGSAVIICPGGSYDHLGIITEGRSTAKWFNEKGTATFILWYRVAKNNFHYPAMMEDIQRTIQLLRENSFQYGIHKNKIAAIGFSAGGHLVCWSGEFGKRKNELEKLGISTDANLQPDFVIPVYPVVTMKDDICHKWSRKSLIGKNPDERTVNDFSLELNVPEQMCPVYLVACKDDPVVIYENSVRLAQALEEKNADYVFKSYDWGGHGFGMMNNSFMKTFHWNEDLYLWLEERGFFKNDN
ncbi:MAG: alpha/beta hydrolase [Spirochaetales bacterium]|nr:alpha/beta hydrolase [Spirochaetia bacterium]MDD7013800.1 alpha/beta hydrolase [Spirochaetales bacterium]